MSAMPIVERCARHLRPRGVWAVWLGLALSTSASAQTFTSASSASPASVAPGATTTLTTTVTNTSSTGLWNGILYSQVYGPAGTFLSEWTCSGASVWPGGSASCSTTWTAPSTMGTYLIKVGVFAAGRSPQYHWNDGSGSFTVSAARPAFSSSSSASPPSVSPGGTTTLTTTVANTSSTALTNGILYSQVYDPAGRFLSEWTCSGASVWPGGSASCSTSWTAPSTTGTYLIKVGVFAAGWSPQYHWNDGSGSVVVGSPPQGCADACPAPNGVTWRCERRFMYGTNYAWGAWGADFGGASWGTPGVSLNPGPYDGALGEMKRARASVVRWWVFPRFLTPSISFGPDRAPTSVQGTLLDDVRAALALAERHDVYLMLTLVSFDDFSDRNDGSPPMTPLVTDPALRQRLFDVVVRPVAQAVEASPYRHRLIAWDLINEPEWAMRGPNPNGGEDFPCGATCPGDPSITRPVTHAEMVTFLNGLAGVLRAANPGALLTVGQAAIKWGTAFKGVALDFHQLHYYDWVHQWYPYTTWTLASVGLTDRPVVMGEFPNDGVSDPSGRQASRTGSQLAADLWAHGYAGALSWAFNDPLFPWAGADLGAFAAQHPCETAY